MRYVSEITDPNFKVEKIGDSRTLDIRLKESELIDLILQAEKALR